MGNPFRKKLEEATGRTIPPDRPRSGRGRGAGRKANAKRWFITDLIEKHPSISDASIHAAVQREFGEGVGAYIIKEVRKIVQDKINTGEIVPADTPVRMENLAKQFDRLSDHDKGVFISFLHNRGRHGVYKRYPETTFPLRGGWQLCSGGRKLVAGEYVRLVDPSGKQYAYWKSSEWRRDPELVMGAIINAMAGFTFPKPAGTGKED